MYIVYSKLHIPDSPTPFPVVKYEHDESLRFRKKKKGGEKNNVMLFHSSCSVFFFTIRPR